MILVDANILIYAYNQDAAQHQAAQDWLDRQLNSHASVGLPWVSLLAFLRIITNPRIFTPPAPMADAREQVRAWLGCEVTWVPGPTSRHDEILSELLALLPGIRGDLVTDAHLAALAIEHGLVVCSADHDFARFPRVRWLDPLKPSRPESRPA